MIFLFFLLYLFLETVISVNVFSAMGGIGAFVEIIFSAIAGIFILKNFHYSFFESFRALSQGEITLEDFEKLGIYTTIGALLLIIPGFFSDLLGVLFQFNFIAILFFKKFLKQKTTKRSDDAIDVDVIDDFDNVR
jgi:UPF0716 family protein affecting phage T7 exclusion